MAGNVDLQAQPSRWPGLTGVPGEGHPPLGPAPPTQGLVGAPSQHNFSLLLLWSPVHLAVQPGQAQPQASVQKTSWGS